VPFLKFSRDRRGYEHFSIVEAGAPRRGRPSRQRLLFWFRTPPQVKVGRLPFTDDVRRAIEAQNPGIRFDWPRLLATPIPPPDAEHWRERRRAEKAAKQAAREAAQEEAAAQGEAPEQDEAGEPSAPDDPAESDAEGTLQAGVGIDAEKAVGERDARIEAVVPADQAPGQTTAAPGTSQIATGAGGHRRRRRGRRRPRPSEPGPAQAAPIAPHPPPTDEV
jgi:hypothetical protein